MSTYAYVTPMKILIPLLLLTLGVNANEVVYGSKHGTFEDANAILITEVAAGETIKILTKDKLRSHIFNF